MQAIVPAAEAKQRARTILAAALAGEWDPDREPTRGLKTGFDEYMKWCGTNRPRATEKRRAATKRLLDSLGDVPLDRVSPLAVERFKRDRVQEGAAPATVNRDLEVLKHFLGLAAAWDWVDDRVTRAVRGVSKIKEPAGRVRYLLPGEEARLLGALPERARSVVQVALLTGMRQGELVGLRKDAVDLDGRVITLTVTKSNRVRRVHVNQALADVLGRAMAGSRGEFVFATRRGKPYTGDGLRCVFRRAVVAAEIRDFRFHDLRHTTATRLRAAGVGLDVVADVLGHATLTMTRRYAHLGEEAIAEAMARLPSPAQPVAPAPKADGAASTSSHAG